MVKGISNADMAEQEYKENPVGHGGYAPPYRTHTNHQLLMVVGVIIISVIAGLALLSLPTNMQLTLILLFPAVAAVILILVNPVIGIYIYYFIEYFRPQSFVPALRPLKLGFVIVVVTIISWTVNMGIRKQRLYWNNFNWPFIAFVGVVASTVLTASNNRYAYNTFEIMLVTLLIYFASTNLVDSFRRLNGLVWMLFIVHFLFALKGISSGGLVKTSLMGDENDYALAMNTMIPFAFFLAIRDRNLWKRALYAIILLSMVLAVVASSSRGGWVGLMAVTAFCVIRSKKVVMSLGLMILMWLAMLAFAPDKYWAEIETITDSHETTAQTRLDYWAAGVRMFLDYPVNGIGAGNGAIRMPEYYAGDRDVSTQWGRTFHGTLPQVLAELGSLGITIYLIMIYLAFNYLDRLRRRALEFDDRLAAVWADSIMGGIIGYIVSATFLSTAYYPQLWTLFTLTIILKRISDASITKLEQG